MSERDKFIARFDELRAAGARDVKFFVQSGAKLSLDDFYAESNRLSQAIQDGQCERHEIWKGDSAPKPFAALQD